MNWYRKITTSGRIINLDQNTLVQIEKFANELIPAFKNLVEIHKTRDIAGRMNELGKINIFDPYKKINREIRILYGITDRKEQELFAYYPPSNSSFLTKEGRISLYLWTGNIYNINDIYSWRSILTHEVTHAIDPSVTFDKGEHPHGSEAYYTINHELEANMNQMVRRLGGWMNSPMTRRKIIDWLRTSNTMSNLPGIMPEKLVLYWDKRPDIIRKFKLKLFNYLKENELV